MRSLFWEPSFFRFHVHFRGSCNLGVLQLLFCRTLGELRQGGPQITNKNTTLLTVFRYLGNQHIPPLEKENQSTQKSFGVITRWFKVTFLGWLSDPFKGLSDLQLGDKKVTLNHLAYVSFQEATIFLASQKLMGPSCRWYIHGDIALGAPKKVSEDLRVQPIWGPNSWMFHEFFMVMWTNLPDFSGSQKFHRRISHRFWKFGGQNNKNPSRSWKVDGAGPTYWFIRSLN